MAHCTSAEAGDIVAILPAFSEGKRRRYAVRPQTVTEPPFEAQPIDPPTLAMTFSINDSPLAGQEGDQGDEPYDRATV